MLRQPIVYGSDDRIEAGYSPATSSIVALIPRAALAYAADAGEQFSLQGVHDLCAGERFAEQPAIANCTGVLLTNDLLLTAAHCLEIVQSCQDYVYVQNYRVEADAGTPDTSDFSILECETPLLVRHTTILDPQYLDFALLQLRGGARDLTPPTVRLAAPTVGELVTAIGTSGGLPLKSTSGVVLHTRPQRDYFDFTADVFGGGSGSAVLDSEGSLLGIHVRGEPDYEYTAEGCWRTRTIAEDGAAGTEQANTITSILDELCQLRPEVPYCQQADESTKQQPAPADPSESAHGSADTTAARNPIIRSTGSYETTFDDAPPAPARSSDATVSPDSEQLSAEAQGDRPSNRGCTLVTDPDRQDRERLLAPALLALVSVLLLQRRRSAPEQG
jgi:hypothetical protein